jgi:hypothetical protein
MGLLGILFRQKNVVIDAPAKVEGQSLGGALLSQLQQGLNQTIGGVAGIVIDATVSEDHSHSCDLTENPVEEGAKITDHVQLKPAELTIEGVITDTPLGFAVIGNIQNLIRSVSTIFGASSRSLDAFDELLALQKSRRPFTVLTGLKRYQNMILTDLSIPRTIQTGKALHFKAVMKEIRIVKSATSAAPRTSSATRSLAGATRNAGQQVTSAAPTSSPLSSATDSGSNPSFARRTFDAAAGR